MRQQAVLMVNRVLEIIISLLLMMTISRLLPVEEMGNYQYFTAINNLIYTLGFFWILLCVTRFLDFYEMKERLGDFYRAVSLYTLVVSGILFVLYAIIGVLINQLALSMLVASALVLHSIKIILIDIHRVRNQNMKYAISSMVFVLMRFGIIFIALMFFSRNYVFIFASIAVSSLVVILINYKLIINIFNQSKSATEPIFIELIKLGVPLAIVSSVEVLLSLSDRFVIDFYFTKVEVGYYSNIYGFIAYVFQAILSIFIESMGPIHIKAWNRNKMDEAIDLLNKNYYTFMFIAIPSIFGLQLVKYEFINIFLGEAYLEVANLILPVSISYILISSIVFAQKGIEYSNKLHYIIRYGLLATAINLTLNILLLKTYGYQFAAITTLISYTIFFFFIARVGRKYMPLHFKGRFLMKVLVASGIMYGLLYKISIEGHIGISLLLKAALGAIVYIVLMSLLNIPFIKKYIDSRNR